jgi:hypothetical protein
VATMKEAWADLAPWIRCLVAGASAGTLIVGAPILWGRVAALVTNTLPQWPAWDFLWQTWLLAAGLVAVAYWSHSPKGREVWTDEQRAQMIDSLKNGKV